MNKNIIFIEKFNTSGSSSEINLLYKFNNNKSGIFEKLVQDFKKIEDPNFKEIQEGKENILERVINFIIDTPLSFENEKFGETCHIAFYFLERLFLLNSKNLKYDKYLLKFANMLTSLKKISADELLREYSLLFNLVPFCESSSNSVDETFQNQINIRYGKIRANIMQKMLKFAILYKKGDLFKGRLYYHSFSAWKIDNETLSNLLISSYKLLRQSSNASNVAQEFLLEILKRNNNNITDIYKNIKYIISIVLHLLESPQNSPKMLIEVYSLDSIRFLKTIDNSRYEILFQLLEMVIYKTVKEFNVFLNLKGNIQKIEMLELNKNDLLFKIQQLTLCDLGKENSLQSFTNLIETLECKTLEKLENIVQISIEQGIIIAKFDFENQKLQIQKVTIRTFKNQEKDWIHFNYKLRNWDCQIKSVISNINKN